MPLLPAIFRERFGENVGRHFVGIAVLNFAEAEFEGNIMQPPEADIMAPFQMSHSG